MDCQRHRLREKDMAHKAWLIALGVIVASPVVAQPEPTVPQAAPEGTPTTRYCLRVDPITGTRIETIQCRTREDWASLEVNVDEEWAQNGVRVMA
jgi:hypothetical protein